MDLPHLGQLPILQGAVQITRQIGSRINKFVTWCTKETYQHKQDKAKKAGTPHKEWEHCLAELLRLTNCVAPRIYQIFSRS